MKAAVLRELGKDLEIHTDVGLTDLKPGEVHVKVAASGVCHSDLSVQNGTLLSPLPAVLGHEGAGVVVEVGDAVTDVAAGDHVIVSFVPACMACRPCLRGQSYLCTALLPMLAPRFVVDGKPAMGMGGCGTFAEELIVPASAVVKIGRDIPLDVASLIGCGVTTGVGAAINTAKIAPGSSVVVIGAGGVGIAAIQGARIAGAAEILAVDRVASKLEAATRFGASHTCTPDALEQLKNEITAGEGFDYALECIGSPATIRATYDATRRGGTAVIVGAGRGDQSVALNTFEIFYTDKALRGSMYGGANVRDFMPRLCRLWKTGRLDLEGMISRRIPLEDVNDAFRAMQEGEVIRSVIDFA
jgi:S-(hydroxymethyl)glutathione dehydrogenase/alcohol dehydrogenase